MTTKSLEVILKIMPEEPKSVNDLPQAKDDIGDPEIAASQKEEDIEPIGPLAQETASQNPAASEEETLPASASTQPNIPETSTPISQEPVVNNPETPPLNPPEISGLLQSTETTSEQPGENQMSGSFGAENELPRIPEANVPEITEIPKVSEETTLPATPAQDSTTSLSSPQPEPSWPPIPVAPQAQVFTQDNQEQPTAQISTSPTPNKKVSIIFVILGLSIIGAAIVLGVLFYNRYQEQNRESTAPTPTTQTTPSSTETSPTPIPPTETGGSSVFGNLLNPGGQPSPPPPPSQ